MALSPLFTHSSPQCPLLIVGPCSAESEEACFQTAQQIRALALPYPVLFRAGLFKQRTHPADFAGCGEKGLAWFKRVQRELGLPVATEVFEPRQLEACLEAGVEAVWIGARTTTNPALVQTLADVLASVEKEKRPLVGVKNPMNPDLNLWLGAIERFERAGVESILAIHRGFSLPCPSDLRYQPLWSLPIQLRLQRPTLPILCDPSHITGRAQAVPSMAQKAMDLGFSGLMIETHYCPAVALSDAKQQLTPEQLGQLVGSLKLPQGAQTGEELQLLRAKIDETDDMLFNLIAQRIELARQVGAYKESRGLSIVQPERFGQILEHRKHLAQAQGLSETLVQAVLYALHDESVRVQLEGRTGNGTAPSNP